MTNLSCLIALNELTLFNCYSISCMTYS